jgi:transcriptional regulator with PAS, ATPase and Fis domain
MDLLMCYSWPGNVRELRNIIERIMIIDNPEIIGCEHIPVEIASGHDNLLEISGLNHLGNFEIPDEGIDIKEFTGSFQAMLVRKALQKSGGKKERAAKLLKIDRFSLRYLINKLDPSLGQSDKSPS